MTILGIVFMAAWLLVSAVWFMMSMMGTLMANDSGSASSSAHTMLLVAMVLGQGMTSLAGVSAGLAFFMRARRRRLLWLFAVLLVAGVLCQYGSLHWFFSTVSAAR
jgi:hypothetical protein